MPDRIVSIDIETTGMHPEAGDKIIEIGAIEMIDLNVTRNVFHQYINPNFPISDSLSSITGITADFLSTQPHFSGVTSNLVEFIAGSPLLSSNISFDMRFLNHELSGLGLGNLAQNGVIDLLKLSRKHFPATRCHIGFLRRFSVNSLSSNVIQFVPAPHFSTVPYNIKLYTVLNSRDLTTGWRTLKFEKC